MAGIAKNAGVADHEAIAPDLNASDRAYIHAKPLPLAEVGIVLQFQNPAALPVIEAG